MEYLSSITSRWTSMCCLGTSRSIVIRNFLNSTAVGPSIASKSSRRPDLAFCRPAQLLLHRPHHGVSGGCSERQQRFLHSLKYVLRFVLGLDPDRSIRADDDK